VDIIMVVMNHSFTWHSYFFMQEGIQQETYLKNMNSSIFNCSFFSAPYVPQNLDNGYVLFLYLP